MTFKRRLIHWECLNQGWKCYLSTWRDPLTYNWEWCRISKKKRSWDPLEWKENTLRLSIKERLGYKWFPVIFTKFLTALFIQNTSWRLTLKCLKLVRPPPPKKNFNTMHDTLMELEWYYKWHFNPSAETPLRRLGKWKNFALHYEKNTTILWSY